MRAAHGLALAMICGSAVTMVGFYRARGGIGYPLDDTWIHLAFARNLAEGHGFGVNVDEPTPGATSPLWVVLLSVGFRMGAGTERWPWLLATGALITCGVLAAGICRDLQGTRRHSLHVLVGSCACGVATVTSFPMVWSTAGALEVPLFGAMMLGALWALSRAGRDGGSWRLALVWGAFAGLAINARPEGLLLVAVLATVAMAAGRRPGVIPALGGGLLAAALAVPYAIFCLRTSGRWLPNTFYAKTLSSGVRFPDPEYLWRLACLLWDLTPVTLLLVPPAVLACVLWWRRDRLLSVPACALAWVVLLPCAYGCMDHWPLLFCGLAGNYGRYLYPVVPPMMAVGFAAVLRAAAARPWPTLRVVCAVTAVALALACLWKGLQGAGLYAHNVRDINRMHVNMAEALDRSFPAGTLVAANDVGVLACFTDLRVLDLMGLVSTDVLDALRPYRQPRPRSPLGLYRLLAERRPEVLVVYPVWFKGMCQWLSPGLTQIAEVVVPDTITAGHLRLVAYQIDWSRVPELPALRTRRAPGAFRDP